MKYRHSFHAGNFADVHKHVALLALLTSMQRKESGFAYFETHAGRGAYASSGPSAEAGGGIDRLLASECEAEELRQYAALISAFRLDSRDGGSYPGSPAIAARLLRPQDRAVLSEIVPAEARLLERRLASTPRMRVERGDGFERLRAWLPPVERRGLVLIDPPYERSHEDFERLTAALSEALRRFATGIYAAWYPIKDQRSISAWHRELASAVRHETLISELWLYPRDSQVALNGSGLVIVNPPYRLTERMPIWLAELQTRLDNGHAGGTRVTKLTSAA